MSEMLESRIEFDENMLKKESIKALVGTGILSVGIGVAIYYMHRSKIQELQQNGEVETIETFVDEENNIIDRKDLESGVYSIDLDNDPQTTIIDEGQLYVVDPDTHRRMSSNDPVSIAMKASNRARSSI